MIVSKQTQEALMEFIKQCFVENRKFDRLVSVLGVKFACNQSAALIHRDIAHYFPQLSDKIGELCLERYNISVIYGETPSGTEDYATVSDIMHTITDRTINFQSMFMGVAKIAFENNDLNVYSDLLHLLVDYNNIVEQAIILMDKIDNYDNVMSFDYDVNKFWVLGEAK